MQVKLLVDSLLKVTLQAGFVLPMNHSLDTHHNIRPQLRVTKYML